MTTTVLKQYGERRTGTNYLRALLAATFPDVLLLAYILGDKHQPPVNFDALWAEAQQADDPALAFVTAATYASRGSASHRGDPTQAAELRARAEAVGRAHVERTLGFVVSIKEPYAWIVSLARFEQWIHADEQPLHALHLERVADACRSYNTRYAAWVGRAEREAGRWHFVPHEDLLADPARELERLATAFALRRAEAAPVAIRERVEPTVWDHLPVLRAAKAFDPSYYEERRYLRQLPNNHREVIARTIDWPLFTRFGYAPLA